MCGGGSQNPHPPETWRVRHPGSLARGFWFELVGLDLVGDFRVRLRATASRIRDFRAGSLSFSFSRMSMARRTLPSRLELKSLAGSFKRGAFGEGEFDDRLVGFAGADDAGVGEDWSAAPFHFFDDFGIGGVDEFADASECLAAPVGERGDAFVDKFCGGCGCAWIIHFVLLSVDANLEFIVNFAAGAAGVCALRRRTAERILR